jgi:hypothetical protein
MTSIGGGGAPARNGHTNAPERCEASRGKQAEWSRLFAEALRLQGVALVIKAVSRWQALGESNPSSQNENLMS